MTPATEPELRWAYRLARLEARGISFETAIGNPCLRACLELGVARQRRRRARQATSAAGAGIERSHPDHSNTSSTNHRP